MNYELLETKYTENYTNAYLKAIENKCEIDCFIGSKLEYRMTRKDSVFTSISDPTVLLEYCIYPLYASGDREIGNRVKVIMSELISKSNIIGIYQVVRFIYVQDKLIKKFDKLPVVIGVSNLVKDILYIVEDLKTEMISYKEGEFSLYPKSIYEMTQVMIKKSKSFDID